MKKTEAQFRKWVKEQIAFYQPILGLTLVKIEVRRATKDDYLSMAHVYPYSDSHLYYSRKAFEDWRKADLPSIAICHELCHLITDPLYCKATERYLSIQEIKDERERLTDTISSIVRYLTQNFP